MFADLSRLGICFLLSVLLHGLLLLAFNTSHRNRDAGLNHDEQANWNALIVRLQSAENDTLHAISTTETAELHHLPVMTPIVAPADKIADILPELPVPARTHPYAPEQRYQARMNYQQMQAMRAQQQAQEQQQFIISHMQTDLEQKLNRQDTRATGRCTWQENETDTAPDLRCEPKSLAHQMQANRKSLLALRNTLRMQGLVMDGFTVSTKENRSVIGYLLHTPSTSTSP